ncbi:hypothetical protein llg_36330 [Luteolibacter sp. LG18]|nr:hypothetical protein llg_36330 [Luteolibacter sp. LG18]
MESTRSAIKRFISSEMPCASGDKTITATAVRIGMLLMLEHYLPGFSDAIRNVGLEWGGASCPLTTSCKARLHKGGA